MIKRRLNQFNYTNTKMKTNKTPIQEFKKDLEEILLGADKTLNVSEAMVGILLEFVIPELLQKEKAFAFDCYMRGYNTADDRFPADFDFFYSQYAEQHID